jgi:hypothetical protein
VIELLCTNYNKKAIFIHCYFSNAVLEKEPLLPAALLFLIFLPAAYLQPVLVFFSCGQTSPDVALRFQWLHSFISSLSRQ